MECFQTHPSLWSAVLTRLGVWTPRWAGCRVSIMVIVGVGSTAFLASVRQMEGR